MDPTGYMAFTAVDLVANSRFRRLGEEIRAQPSSGLLRRKNAEILEKKSNNGFHFTFSKNSQISEYLFSRKTAGNSTILFGGKIVIGPRWEGFILFTSIIVVSFLQVVVSTTWPTLSDETSSVTEKIISWLIHVFFVLSFTFILLTGFSNPGIVPRNDSMGIADPKSIDSTTGYLIPRYLLLNGVCVRQKFCRTCKIYRPPRSNHCSVCDNCVLKFDHHCPALGTCIGLCNYSGFLSLTLSLVMYFVFLLAGQELALGQIV